MIVKNCIFENCGNGTNGGSSNSPVFGADGSGKVEISRCLVYKSSRIIGGITGTDDITITNCTFANLNGEWGGVMPNVREVKNTIVYKGDQNTCEGNAPKVTYCLFTGHSGAWADPINGMLNSNGNMDDDPLFINPEDGDYRLSKDSPCIDAGDPNSPKDPDGTVADIGFYYYSQGTDIIADIDNLISNNKLYCHVNDKNLQVSSNLEGNVTIVIYDLKGKVISSSFLSNVKKCNINIYSLSSGVYCIKAKNVNAQVVKQFQIFK